MEHLIFVGTIAIIILIIFVKGAYDDKKKQKKLIYKLRHEYGVISTREYRPEHFSSIARYFSLHKQEGCVDDITWNDLNMDDVFKSMNDTYSSAGEEVLYHTLRTPKFSKEELEYLEELVEYFSAHTDDRIKLQLLFQKLGYTGRFSMYDYIKHLDILGERSNLKHWLANGLLLASLIFCLVNPTNGILAFVGMMLINMFTYFKEKNEIDPYIISFAYVMRLIQTSGKIASMNDLEVIKEERLRLRTHRKALSNFKRGAFLLKSSTGISGADNPFEIIVEYFRMVCHIDLMKFNSMLDQVRRHEEDVDVLFSTIGYLETAIVIGAYRKSVESGWCVPVLFGEKERTFSAKEIYHPLISNPVKNSISVKRGVLLTGSNASGKSTFLKTVAINAIFAQTIHTVLADAYEAGYFEICSSMALRDDLAGGESYYIVEIRAIKRILDAVGKERMVLCFVDEVLRGTNTVERISASTEILKSLAGENVMCFAATHDVELTELLDKVYDNYHFEEEIVDGDVKFNYRLLNGKATTRNAIKLLGVMGYDEEIIKNANRRAETFMQTGQWN